MLGNKLINTNAGGGCTDTVDLYNPFPDGGGIALYQLNGDATDVSGNYDGTATNVTYGAGEFGQAGVFNGSSSIIDLPNNSFNFTTVSVSFWLKLNSITGEDYVLDVYDEASAARGYAISTDASNKIKFRAWNNNFSEVFSSSTLSLNTWYYIAMVATQTSASIYINGSLDNFGSLNGFSFQAQQSTSIGAFRGTVGGGSVAFLDGSLDQVRIFSRALRPYEVEALYTEEYCAPTIVPSEHFNTVLYTGNGSTQSITGVGFQPDFTWIKVRTNTDNHVLQDSVRGVGKGLFSDLTNAENASMGGMTSFDSDGFTFDGSVSTLNGSARDFVAWNFKAGGAAVTNTDGTITSQVSANTEAGFSVVTWTGNGAANATVGHGLNNTPSLYITKRRNSTGNWVLFATTLLPTVDAQEYLVLNNTDGSNGASQALPNSNILNVESIFDNIGSATYVAYCFAEVEGFSNFGSYVGTGASGNTVVTGFEPAFVMIKRTDAAGGWLSLDNKRDTTNPRELFLSPNTSQAEFPVTNGADFLENGFTMQSTNGSLNASGGSYIYMAFAADPTTIEPSLEDSFNTVLYTGNRPSTQSITGVGFQPDLVWIKDRVNGGYPHVLTDSVRGNTKYLQSNSTGAELTTTSGITSFDSDGFSLGANGYFNGGPSGAFDPMVAWAWKGAELPAINSNGSIPSVVSANPAAGFSIVSTKSNGSGYLNFGHGLDSAPELVITKFTSQAGEWYTYTSAIANGFDVALKLNGSDAAITAYGADKWSSTDSVVGVGNSQWYFTANVPFITYCFHSVAGFSKFGSYTGTGNTSGSIIECGFEPAFVMIKCSTTSTNWVIYDNKRDTANPRDHILIPNTSGAEVVGYSGTDFDFNLTSFQARGSEVGINASGQTYIYMAFANQF